MNKVLNIENAIAIAALAHNGQKYGDNESYIWHSIRVANRIHRAGHDDELVIIAILHDVVEDSDWTLERLREMGASERVINGVDGMSRREYENYAEFIERVKGNPDARIVKRADMEENLSQKPPESLAKKYQKYLAIL